MSIKRTIITTILALALVATVAPAVTTATTIDDLLAQITTLQAQLLALQGQPSDTGGIPSACVGITFTRNLTVGSTGSDVKCLQALLNRSVATQVATTGAGAPGSETSYFGGLTLAAVKVYQAQHGWTPANQVGPMTRAALNASLVGGVVIVTPPTTGCPVGAVYNNVTGGLCAAPAGLPAGCTSTAGYSPLSGASCSTGVVAPVLPAGCTSTAGYSQLTGVSCATGVSNQPVGLTGFIDASTLAASPSSNANVTTTANVPVLGVNIKAINANMTVNSLKVQLGVTKNSAAEHPSTLVQKLYVYDGSTLLTSFGVDTNSVYKTAGGLYYVILSGFNFNIPANTTKVLTINADFAPSLETSRILTINLFDTSSVGAVDGTGAQRTGGIATTRVYTVAYATVGTSTLVGTASISTPISSSVNINATSGTTDVPMLVFNVKSTVGASILTDLTFTATGDALAVAKMTAVKLYDGSTLLGSKSLSGVVSGSTAAFTDLAIAVAKDQTKALTVKADFAAGVTNGSKVALTITPTSQFAYTTPNLSAGVLTSSGGIITGKDMYLYNGQAAVLSFVSAASSYTYNSTNPSESYTTGVIIFDIKADGGELTKILSEKVVAEWNSTTLAAGNVSVSVAPNTATPDGSTARVTVNMTVPRSVSSTGFVNFNIHSIAWTVGNSGEVVQTWGLDDYKTPYANVQ